MRITLMALMVLFAGGLLPARGSVCVPSTSSSCVPTSMCRAAALLLQLNHAAAGARDAQGVVCANKVELLQQSRASG